MSQGIVFEVETERVLKILAREIYDSPLALLRENLQNAYDAIRMRFAVSGTLLGGGLIHINLVDDTLTISDNGIGMTEEVLRENFWKAGSSGKHSVAARKAGVVGTFGIGAMANFGVCRRLIVETRAEGSGDLLKSIADRDSLKIAQACISFEREPTDREVGTTLTVLLDATSRISVGEAKKYLQPYVALLPVPVYLNGELISLAEIESLLKTGGRTFSAIGSQDVTCGPFKSACEVQADSNGQVLVRVGTISLDGNSVDGMCVFLQSGGPLFGLRSNFGLATIPAAGPYHFGGLANLSFLQPTAGREALGRDSILQVSNLITSAEFAASQLLSKTDFADRNASFLQWLVSNKRWDLAPRVKIHALPEDQDVELGQVLNHIGSRSSHYYKGNDLQIINRFVSGGACLLQVSPNHPRQQIQLNHLTQALKVQEVPDKVHIIRVWRATELTAPEASVLLRIASVLRDDYLVLDVDIQLVDMSHGVEVYAWKDSGNRVCIRLARSSRLLAPVIEFRRKAIEVFGQFMKDFVRLHIYPHVQQFVPSSTKGGVDALIKHLEQNREIYRYADSERGDLEGVLGEYLSGTATLTELVHRVRGGGGWSWGLGQNQRLSSDQVGSVESVVPGVVESPILETSTNENVLIAVPPIIRGETVSDMKLLTTEREYPQLNGFRTFLGLSDRVMQTEGSFFRTPHTTRVIWGGHRVIYIFTDATGELSLYYDIELRDPINPTLAGGGLFRSTTLITKTRIFIPVPSDLFDEFRVSSTPREFVVRFDLLNSDVPSAPV